MCVPAPACRAALDEATELWPDRSRISDGICGDARHQARTSDHNDGNAWDLTHDPDHGVDTHLLADLMRRHPDPRVKYVISNGRIWNPAVSPDWRAYAGENPHEHHMHVSILATARDDCGPWFAHLITHPQEELLMAAALNDDDARRTLIRGWYLDYLGRGIESATAMDQKLAVFRTKGADACLASIVDSTEAIAYRKGVNGHLGFPGRA